MFFYRLTGAAGWPTLTGTGMSAAGAWFLTSGKAIAGSQLNLQLDDFIPLLIGTVAFGYRKQLTQTAAVIEPRRCRWLNVHGGRRRRLGNRRIA